MGHKLDVALRPGETLIANTAVQFPSGPYKRVWGFRSFRDFHGRDISASLPGWPAGRSSGEPPARNSAKGRLKSGLWTATALAGYIVEGLTSGGDWPSPSNLEDHEDYVVLRADPGTVALGAPWQLDPGRNKAKPRVVLHVTAHRLLFTDPRTGALLWECGRPEVKDMTPGVITRITFADASQIRILLVKDKDALIPDREENYRTIMVKGKPTRIARTSDPRSQFAGILKDFLAASPTESA